jgi:hypothetical protein
MLTSIFKNSTRHIFLHARACPTLPRQRNMHTYVCARQAQHAAIFLMEALTLATLRVDPFLA